MYFLMILYPIVVFRLLERNIFIRIDSQHFYSINNHISLNFTIIAATFEQPNLSLFISEIVDFTIY